MQCELMLYLFQVIKTKIFWRSHLDERIFCFASINMRFMSVIYFPSQIRSVQARAFMAFRWAKNQRLAKRCLLFRLLLFIHMFFTWITHKVHICERDCQLTVKIVVAPRCFILNDVTTRGTWMHARINSRLYVVDEFVAVG